MDMFEAFDLINEAKDLPVFKVKVGDGVTHRKNLTFWEALEEFDHCESLGLNEENEDMVYICSPSPEIDAALDKLFKLGYYRS